MTTEVVRPYLHERDRAKRFAISFTRKIGKGEKEERGTEAFSSFPIFLLNRTVARFGVDKRVVFSDNL